MWCDPPFFQKKNKATQRAREGGGWGWKNLKKAVGGRQYRGVFIKLADWEPSAK